MEHQNDLIKLGEYFNNWDRVKVNFQFATSKTKKLFSKNTLRIVQEDKIKKNTFK